MKKSMKYVALWGLLLSIGFQFFLGVNQTSAQDNQVTLSLLEDTKEISANSFFTVNLKDSRTESDILSDEKIVLLNPTETIDAKANSNQESLTKTYLIDIPEGIEFSNEEQQQWLAENNLQDNSSTYTFNEMNRQLSISTKIDTTDTKIRLYAQKSGDYSVNLISNKYSSELNIGVKNSIITNSDSRPQSRMATLLDSSSTAIVNNWDEFVNALGSATITNIQLGADISLSGTLTDNYGVFDKSSIDTSTDFSYLYVNKSAISRSITIDGGGHTFDFGNLAIGFSNSSINTQSYWNISMQNINVKSTNYYAPFFYPVLTGTSGITNSTALSNSKLTYGTNYTHTRYVKTFEELSTALVTLSVTNIQFTTDIIVPLGLNDISRKVANYNNVAESICDTSTVYNTATTWMYFRVAGSARNVVIDGDGYTLDQGSITWCFRNPTVDYSSTAWNITYQNMNTYHGNYWGIAEFWDLTNTNHAKCTINFKDFTNHGTQLIESQFATVNFSGNIYVQQVATYTSVRKDGTTIRDFNVNYTNNQTISVSTATIAPNSTVYLSALTGVPVHLRESGNLVIGENAKVDLVRESTTGNPENDTQGYPSVIDIKSGDLIIKQGATVNATSHHSVQPTVVYFESANSNLDVQDGATLNIITDNYTSSTNGARYNPVYMAGGKVNVNGTMNITGKNMGNSGTHLFYSDSKVSFVIGTKGTLNIVSDSTSLSQYLMYFGSSTSTFEFSDAEYVNLQRTQKLNNSAGLVYMANGGILDVSVQNVYQWANTVSQSDTDWDYAYEPMSNMILTYNGTAMTVTKANSIYMSVVNNFKSVFKTAGQQRILFTRIPNPEVAITSVSNDNPNNSGSKTVTGWARPGSYIRIWDTSDYITTNQLAKSKGTDDSVKSPVDDLSTIQTYRDNFTVQADTVTGNWSYTVPEGKIFTAESVIHVYGFNNLKDEELTQVVLDKNPPAATGITYTTYVGEPLPDPSVLVKNVSDTNPTNKGFTYSYKDSVAAQSILDSENIDGKKVEVLIKDDAGNESTVESTFIVYGSQTSITGSSVELSYVDIRNMTDSELSNYILSKCNPVAFNISNGVKTTWDDSSKFQVSNLGDLSGLTGITPNKDYPVTIMLPKSVTGLDTDLTTNINVKIINMNSTLTIQFEDEAGTVLSGYTLTAGEAATNSISTPVYVGDTIDLTSATFKKVQDQLTALQTAGYEVVTRPTDETALPITDVTQTVTYTVKGLLFLKSAPSAVDFGSLIYNAKTQRVDNPTTNGDLIITDTRATKTNGWTLYAAVTTEMKNTSTGSIMSDALRYVTTAGKEVTLSSSNQAVYTNTTGGTTDITSGWGTTPDTAGLKLVADPNKTTVSSVGTYSGVITWTIMAGQP